MSEAPKPLNGIRDKRVDLWRLLGTVLCLGLAGYLLISQGVGEFVETVKQVPLAVFSFAVLLIFCSRFMITLRWLALLHSMGLRLGLFQGLRLVFMGLFASNFLPTTVGGDAIRLIGIAKRQMDVGAGTATLIMDRIVGSLGMATLLPVGLPMVWPFLKPTLGRFPSSVVREFTVLTFTRRIWRFFAKLIVRVFETLRYWLAHPKGVFLALLATYGHMTFTFLTAWLLLRSLGQDISFITVAALWSLSYFITLLPISINGLGVQEISITYLYTHLGGVTPQASLVLAALMRLLYIIGSLPGALFLPEILEGIHWRRAR